MSEQTACAAPDAATKTNKRIGWLAIAGLCVIVAVTIALMLRGRASGGGTAVTAECNANNYAQFAFDGDTLYFAGYPSVSDTTVELYTVDAKTGERQTLASGQALEGALRRFRLCGDHILYLAARAENYEIGYLTKDGSGTGVITSLPMRGDATVSEFDFANGVLYYLYGGTLYAQKTGGGWSGASGDPRTVAQNVSSFALSGKKLYYASNTGVYVQKSGSLPEQIVPEDAAAGIAVSGKNVYYRNPEGIFYAPDDGSHAVYAVTYDARVTTFCVTDGTVYYIRAVSDEEKAQLASDLAQNGGMSESEATELLLNVGHLFRVSGTGGTPVSVGGRYMAAFYVGAGRIYYKSFLYSHTFYEYIEE